MKLPRLQETKIKPIITEARGKTKCSMFTKSYMSRSCAYGDKQEMKNDKA